MKSFLIQFAILIRVSKLDNISIIVHIEVIGIEYLKKRNFNDATFDAKATAVWLIENTALTFEQVATFCQPHALEVQAIADGEVGIGMQGFDPIANGQLSRMK